MELIRIDCSRCWFGRRKTGPGLVATEVRIECAHPAKARAFPKPVRMLGPTGLVQVASCPRNS